MSLDLVRIVAATDFSDDAGNAVRRAAMLALQQRVELELLHVVNRPWLDAVRSWIRTPANVADRLVEDARHNLEQFAGSLGTQASARVAVGDVLDEIISSCDRNRLLAVGARGLSPLRDAILGTTAERLVGRCDCSILVVRKPAEKPYRSVLVAVDLLPGSENALTVAAQIAPGARMAAVHAYHVPFEATLHRAGVAMKEIEQYRSAAFHTALQTIGTMSGTATGDPTRFLPIVDRGHAARLILEHEQALSADLLVIGKRQRSAVEALILGSTTRHVLADAGCDVLVVPLAR
jgi:nucleotide-binding universal stress UspA family protein